MLNNCVGCAPVSSTARIQFSVIVPNLSASSYLDSASFGIPITTQNITSVSILSTPNLNVFLVINGGESVAHLNAIQLTTGLTVQVGSLTSTATAETFSLIQHHILSILSVDSGSSMADIALDVGLVLQKILSHSSAEQASLIENYLLELNNASSAGTLAGAKLDVMLVNSLLSSLSLLTTPQIIVNQLLKNIRLTSTAETSAIDLNQLRRLIVSMQQRSKIGDIWLISWDKVGTHSLWVDAAGTHSLWTEIVPDKKEW